MMKTQFRHNSPLLITAALCFALGPVPVAAEVIQACYNTTNGQLRRVNRPDDCRVSEAYFTWNSAGQEGELALIQGDAFDTGTLFPADWVVQTNTGSTVTITNNQLELRTVPDIGVGEATVRGTRQASVSDGTLIFKTRPTFVYFDHAIYGNAQPRGLANGSDLSNSITFITALPLPSTVACRTTKNGTSTLTNVDIGQPANDPAVYQIVAKPDEVKFFVNGQLKCVHTTNIPTTPLNIYFSTSDGGAGNVPVLIDYVTFERRYN